MDNYENSMTALKIPFFSLGLRFPAGDVLNAVTVVRTINSSSRNCPLSPVSCFLSPFLPFSISTSLLMTNDQ